jgi:hypothetical protein
MTNRLLKSFVALTTFCLMLAFATPASAQQWREQWRDRDRDSRASMVERLIRQAENRSDQFVLSLDRRRGGGFFEQIFDEFERSGGLRSRAHDLETQLNALRQESFNGDERDLRSGVANVLSVAEDVNNVMRYRRMDSVVERQWAMLRSDLNRLARIYNLRELS